MKTMAMIMIVFLFPSIAFAMRATSVENSLACITKENLDEMIQFTAAGDRDNFAAYITQKKCIVLKGGIDVTVIDSPGMFGGICSFIFKGFKFWTTRNGLIDYRIDDSEKKVINPKINKDARIPTAEEQAAEWHRAQEIFNKKKK